MQRGEIWTLRDSGYASKARPAIIIQDETAATFDSIILCLLTTYNSSEIDTRVLIKPTTENGLNEQSFVMTDKIVTVDKNLLGYCIGKVSEKEQTEISRNLKRILGIMDA